MLFPPEAIGDFQVIETTVSVTTTVGIVAPASPSRVALILGTASGVQITVGTRANIIAGTGLAVVNTTPPIQILWVTHGALVNATWYGIVTAPANLVRIEVLYLPNSREQK